MDRPKKKNGKRIPRKETINTTLCEQTVLYVYMIERRSSHKHGICKRGRTKSVWRDSYSRTSNRLLPSDENRTRGCENADSAQRIFPATIPPARSNGNFDVNHSVTTMSTMSLLKKFGNRDTRESALTLKSNV